VSKRGGGVSDLGADKVGVFAQIYGESRGRRHIHPEAGMNRLGWRGRRIGGVCNLYNITTTRDAVMQFTKAFSDKAGWNEPSLDVYPGYQAPVVRVGEDGQREIARVSWGMPSPPT